jgi:hypothetical protein
MHSFSPLVMAGKGVKCLESLGTELFTHSYRRLVGAGKGVKRIVSPKLSYDICYFY